MTRSRLRLAAVALLFGLAATSRAGAADPDTLWHIVHDRCVPDEAERHDPDPCAFVDLAQGAARGYAVLKDKVGKTQYLVLPTARTGGIESPEILVPDAPNYMEDAWAARRFVIAAAPAPLARDDLSLAINSVGGRTQNQLHIHVDCIRADVRAALLQEIDAVGETWVPLRVPFAGHGYRARRVDSDDLAGVNPFLLLAAQSADVRAHMGLYTLVVAGETFGGKPGFILLADRADPARGDFASGEELQDHACALAGP